MSLPLSNTPRTTDLSLDKSSLYVSVLLPLAVQGLFTYLLPTEFADRVEVGMRVVVQFGAKRYYTGIVMDVLNELPTEAQQSKLKSVVDVVDKKPLLLPSQLRLWQWMARYYMCTEGEVMKAALPSGLKIESETVVLRNADFLLEKEQLNDTELQIFSLLDDDKGHTIMAIEKVMGRTNLLRHVRKLITCGALIVKESVSQSYSLKQVYI